MPAQLTGSTERSIPQNQAQQTQQSQTRQVCAARSVCTFLVMHDPGDLLFSSAESERRRSADYTHHAAQHALLRDTSICACMRFVPSRSLNTDFERDHTVDLVWRCLFCWQLATLTVMRTIYRATRRVCCNLSYYGLVALLLARVPQACSYSFLGRATCPVLQRTTSIVYEQE